MRKDTLGAAKKHPVVSFTDPGKPVCFDEFAAVRTRVLNDFQIHNETCWRILSASFLHTKHRWR